VSVQVPDAEKRKQADLVIDTNMDANFTRIQIAELVFELESRFGKPPPDMKTGEAAAAVRPEAPAVPR
jgi:hypothetical protein